jgi:hypothetical protein
LVDEIGSYSKENSPRFQKNLKKNMSRIKITDLQPDNHMKERKLFETDMIAITGGIQVRLLGDNFVNLIFNGFILTI